MENKTQTENQEQEKIYATVYAGKVPGPHVPQGIVLIERDSKKYGFFECGYHGLFAKASEDQVLSIESDAKEYDFSVLEVRDAIGRGLVNLVLEDFDDEYHPNPKLTADIKNLLKYLSETGS